MRLETIFLCLVPSTVRAQAVINFIRYHMFTNLGKIWTITEV